MVFNRGPGGIGSPLYALEAAAEAWAFGSALRLHAMGVYSAQVFCWHCAAPLAAQALKTRDDEFDRLRGYFVSPIRSHEILPVWLPGMILENDIRKKVAEPSIALGLAACRRRVSEAISGGVCAIPHRGLVGA